MYPLKSYRLAPLLAEIMNVSVSFSLTALQDTSSVPPTARQSVWQQAQKRVFMEKDYNSCRGDKPALPPTSAIPCRAVRKQSCQLRSTANSKALVMLCVRCRVSVSNVQ